MSEFPRELIRQVQISTRSAAGLPSYDPSDPTLPALPSLSATIATLEPSPPHLRCKLCKGRLLRGLQSNICAYCGSRCRNEAVPDPICFNSTIGYQWLLRSLGLDGSEMVKPQTSKNEYDQGQSSPKAEMPLSDFINFKIAWPAEIEKQEATVSDKHSEETKRSWSPTGVAGDNFFFKSLKVGTAGTKEVEGLDYQNLSQNVQPSDPADQSAIGKTTDSLSEWQADFQFAISDHQHGATKSSDNFVGSSDDSGSRIQDFQTSHLTSSEVDLSAHMDSVFGHKEDIADGKPTDNPVASRAFDDWDLNDLWTNMGRNESQLVKGSDAKDRFENLDNLSTSADLSQDFQWQANDADILENKTMNWEHNTKDESQTGDGFDATFSAKDDLTREISNNLSTSSDDLFQDFQWKTNEADITSSKAVNEEPSTYTQTQLDEGSFDTNESKTEPTNVDLFQDFQRQSNKTDTNESKTVENNTVNGDAFDEWNDFTGSTSLQDVSQNSWIQSDHLSTSHRNLADIDMFSPNSAVDERDIDGFPEPNLFSTSTVNKRSTLENAISSKPSVNRWALLVG